MGIGLGTFGVKRQQIPMEPNPLDKCTIVSAYHRDVRADKPTITPGKFFIPKVTGEDFNLLVVGTSSWWREIDEHQPLLEIPCSSYQVANSIVNDHRNSLLGVNANQYPAIFIVLGEYDKVTINTYIDKISKKSFKVLLGDAIAKQKNYYAELVKIADILWARTSGNPLAIADEARVAAIQLGLDKTKPWMQDFKTMEMTNCKSCGHLVNPQYPICANCKMPIDGIAMPSNVAINKA